MRNSIQGFFEVMHSEVNDRDFSERNIIFFGNYFCLPALKYGRDSGTGS